MSRHILPEARIRAATLTGGHENLKALNESGELAAAVRNAPALNAPL